jgi:hypothetical protein
MPNTRGPQRRHTDIAIVRDGTPYTGSYTVEKGLLTVTGISGTKTTQLDGSERKRLAEMLLSEIVAEHKAKMNPKP